MAKALKTYTAFQLLSLMKHTFSNIERQSVLGKYPMRYEEAVKLLKSYSSEYFYENGGTLQTTIKKMSWKLREKLASLTGAINFKCEFKNGKCVKDYRDFNLLFNDTCCYNCYTVIGYLDCIPNNHVDEIVKLFKPKHGFYVPDIGCSLPRKWRGSPCLVMSCDSESTAAARHILTWDTMKEDEDIEYPYIKEEETKEIEEIIRRKK